MENPGAKAPHNPRNARHRGPRGRRIGAGRICARTSAGRVSPGKLGAHAPGERMGYLQHTRGPSGWRAVPDRCRPDRHPRRSQKGATIPSNRAQAESEHGSDGRPSPAVHGMDQEAPGERTARGRTDHCPPTRQAGRVCSLPFANRKDDGLRGRVSPQAVSLAV